MYKYVCIFVLRPGHSTGLAALKLLDHLIAQIDMYNVAINMYVNIFKEFDAFDHSILLSKLKYYGVTGCSYDLLRSYLTDISQYVEFSGHKSDALPISTGVPQCSVLSLLLFIIYINEL